MERKYTNKKISHAEFLQKLKEENPVIYSQIEFLEEYINRRVPLIGKTKYGNIRVAPSYIHKVKKLSIHQAVNKSEYWKKMAEEVHKDTYDYSLVNYIDIATEVEIICKIHGVFKQTPPSHISGSGCQICGEIQRGKSERIMTHEQFLKKFKKLYPEEFNKLTFLEEYTIMEKKILAKNKYGLVNILPHGVLRGSKVGLISAVDKTDYVIAQFKEVHGDLYSYNDVTYKDGQIKVSVTCPIHGNFRITPDNHKQGQKCFMCQKELNSGFKRSTYVRKMQGRECFCYIIKCYNENESFYKIGISVDIYRRFRNNKAMPYEYKVVHEFKGSGGYVWDKEKELHRLHKEIAYKPAIHFQGDTECFSDIL